MQEGFRVWRFLRLPEIKQPSLTNRKNKLMASNKDRFWDIFCIWACLGFGRVLLRHWEEGWHRIQVEPILCCTAWHWHLQWPWVWAIELDIERSTKGEEEHWQGRSGRPQTCYLRRRLAEAWRVFCWCPDYSYTSQTDVLCVVANFGALLLDSKKEILLTVFIAVGNFVQ